MKTCERCNVRIGGRAITLLCQQCRKDTRPARQCYYCAEGVPWDGKSGKAICPTCRETRSRKPEDRVPRPCYRCGEPSSGGSKTHPICASCRALNLCTDCGNKHEGMYVRCDSCRVRRSANRTTKLKNCTDCGRTIRGKSNSNYCASCTHQRQKHPCADCGTPVDRRATRCTKCNGKRQRGEAAPSWKGGRTFMISHGYVLQQCPEHPRANNGYVREHILVMENKIGRRLLPGETVHHMNGVRHDNRPENLELWSGSQPSGQRTEDKAAWAREILALYGTDEERERYSAAASDLHVTRVLSAS